MKRLSFFGRLASVAAAPLVAPLARFVSPAASFGSKAMYEVRVAGLTEANAYEVESAFRFEEANFSSWKPDEVMAFVRPLIAQAAPHLDRFEIWALEDSQDARIVFQAPRDPAIMPANWYAAVERGWKWGYIRP